MLYIKFQPNIILGWGVVLKYGRLTDVIYAFLALYNFFFGRKHNNETFQLLTVLYTYYRGWHKSIVCTNFNYVKLSRCANLPKHHPPLFRNKRFILDEITYLVKRFKIGHIFGIWKSKYFFIIFEDLSSWPRLKSRAFNYTFILFYKRRLLNVYIT